jgi:hypothetical protein
VTRADAASAGFNRFDAAVSYRFYFLKIRVPYGTGFVVGMAHIVTEARAFTADITFSGHNSFLQLIDERELIAD